MALVAVLVAELGKIIPPRLCMEVLHYNKRLPVDGRLMVTLAVAVHMNSEFKLALGAVERARLEVVLQLFE